ncbi:hypothetical protein C0J52_19117 [Blattella germanica]|nr:hypothetical protein C0J52_19117 [Blattella germanica]
MRQNWSWLTIEDVRGVKRTQYKTLDTAIEREKNDATELTYASQTMLRKAGHFEGSKVVKDINYTVVVETFTYTSLVNLCGSLVDKKTIRNNTNRVVMKGVFSKTSKVLKGRSTFFKIVLVKGARGQSNDHDYAVSITQSATHKKDKSQSLSIKNLFKCIIRSSVDFILKTLQPDSCAKLCKNHLLLRKYQKDAPTRLAIRKLVNKFRRTESVTDERRAGRPPVSPKSLQRVREAIERTPKASTRRLSREPTLPKSTVWKVLHYTLKKAYHVQDNSVYNFHRNCGTYSNFAGWGGVPTRRVMQKCLHTHLSQNEDIL